MFLTKECDYGIRITRALADNKQKAVPIICEMENIPQQYAYKILKKMERAGIVQSKRGPDGGYRLVKTPNSFTMYDIVSAIDEKLFLSECLKSRGQLCPRNTPEAPCAVHRELHHIQDMLIREMLSKSMEEILNN